MLLLDMHNSYISHEAIAISQIAHWKLSEEEAEVVNK